MHWPRVRGWTFLTIVVIAIAVWLIARRLSELPAKNDPFVMLQAASRAVALIPAETFDVVLAARPRYGLEPGGNPYSGIRINPDPDSSEIFLSPGDTVAVAMRLLRSLVITPGCMLRLEHYVDRFIRISIEQAPDTVCVMRAEYMVFTSGDGYRESDDTVRAASPARLLFRPPFPLVLRDVPVARLGFETRESGEWRSAIVEARLTLRDFDEHTEFADVGDAFVLGALRGSIVELIVGDTMRTVFTGTAEHPTVGHADLRPSLLQELARNERVRLVVTIVLSAVTLLIALLQAVLR